VMTLDVIRSSGRERRVALAFLFAAGVTLFFTLEAAMFLGVVSSYRPETFDALAYVADASFGANVSFEVGELFRDVPVVAAICTLIYLAPPPGLIFLFSLQVKSRRHPPVDIVTALLAMGAVGYSLYFLFPVCGPKFAFASFPANAPDAASLVGAIIPVPVSPRNGIPSLHMASALIAFTQARRYGWRWSAVAAVFVIGTFLATMGTGEHYFVDLVVALPFTIAVHAAITPALRFRLRAGIVLSMALLFFVWLAAIRFLGGELMRHTSFPWSLLAVTLAGSLLAGTVLRRATDDEASTARIGKVAIS
jgi:hypothetical protein